MAITPPAHSVLEVADTGSEETVSISLPSSVEGDVIFAFVTHNVAFTATNTFDAAGWETIRFVAGASGVQPPEIIAWKAMGATPDTSVDLDIGASGGYDNTALVAFCVVSGADTSTFMDVAFVGPTDNGTGDADSGPITPVTDGAYVLSLGLEIASAWALGSPPPGYDTPASGLAEQSTFLDLALFLAGKIVPTAGTEDPGAWNNTVTSPFGAQSYTFAFRPASGGSSTDVNLDAGSYTQTGQDITVVPPASPIPLGKWSGGSVAILPSTSWAAPANLFPTEDRNDDSAYSFAAATSTLTLPATDLANGYLVIGAFEFEDTSNGRHNPQGRFVQASGTGNFVSGSSSGFNRDATEDRPYVRTWAFVNNPSASSTLQFQWRRDSDAPTGGTVRSEFQVIPLYYSNHGIYSSASTACPGGTTPTQITGFSAVDESDTSAIEIASNVVTLKGDNKRYLALGSSYWQGIGNARTQRWQGFRVDGTMDDTAKGYSYGRNAANADIGEMFTTIIDRATTDITLDQFVYRGPAVGAFPNAGADVDGNTTGSNPNHVTVVLELNDGAEVFRSHSTTQQDIDVAGTRVDLQIADSVDFNDSASFAKTSATEIDSVQATDVLLGANVGGGYATSSTARYTGYSEFTVNGTGQSDTFAGDYGRGDQGTQDCWGWSANLMSFVATSASDELGVNAGKITGGEGGTVDTLSGWVGFWGLNIQTLNNTGGGPSTTEVDLNAGSYTQTGNPLGVTVDKNINLDAGSFAFTGQDLTVSIAATTNVDLDAGAYTLAGHTLTIDVINITSIDLDAGSYSFTGNALTIDVDAVTNVDLDLGTYSLTGHALSITQGANVDLDAGSYTFSGQSLEIVRTTAVSLDAGAYTLAGFDLGVSTAKQVDLDAGLYAFTGNNLDLGFAYQVSLDTGAYNLVGQAIAVDLDNSTTIPLDVGSYSFSGQDLNISVSSNVNLDAGSYTLSGHDLDVDLDAVTNVDLDTGVYSCTGHNLSIVINQDAKQIRGGMDFYAGQAKYWLRKLEKPVQVRTLKTRVKRRLRKKAVPIEVQEWAAVQLEPILGKALVTKSPTAPAETMEIIDQTVDAIVLKALAEAEQRKRLRIKRNNEIAILLLAS